MSAFCKYCHLACPEKGICQCGQSLFQSFAANVIDAPIDPCTSKIGATFRPASPDAEIKAHYFATMMPYYQGRPPS